MRKSFAVIGVILMFAMVAAAQDVPKMETFLGYTYTRASTATDIPSLSANGGSSQFVYNFGKYIGAVADLGAVHNGKIGGDRVDNTTATFLFGPRLSLHYSRIRPYFQVLWGGAYLAASTQVNAIVEPSQPIYLPGEKQVVTPIPGQAVTARLVASQTAFSMTAGGGLDIKISKSLSFRPIGLEYFMTRFQNFRTLNDNNQNSLRYTTGFNFNFGAR